MNAILAVTILACLATIYFSWQTKRILKKAEALRVRTRSGT